MTISRDTIDQIRQSVDIVELIGRYVTLQRRGANHTGLCPFHQERTPSFSVSGGRKMYYCYGCQAKGDAFSFLQDMEGLAFPEAVRELADRCGIEIEERTLTPDEVQALQTRATLYDVLEEAAQYFEASLHTQQVGEEARAYLDTRDIPLEVQREARVGYAPWKGLAALLNKRGFDPDLAIQAGLVRKSDRGQDDYYDFFRHRVMFPILDDRKRVIGFGGRQLGDAKDFKYINTPETPLYKKSHVLYGWHRARRAIQQKRRAILVEGYLDVIAMQRAGFDETIAVCGTSLTPTHIQRIRHLAQDIVLFLDGDKAGVNASMKALPEFMKQGIQGWRVQLPDGQDPDDLLRAAGPEPLQQALDQREPLLEWTIDENLNRYGQKTSAGFEHTYMGRQRVLEDLAPILAEMRDAEYVERVTRRLQVSTNQVREAIAKRSERRRTPQPEESYQAVAPPEERYTITREIVHLLWLVVHLREEVHELYTLTPEPCWAGHAPIRPILQRITTGDTPSVVLSDTEDPQLANLLAQVCDRSALYEAEDAEKAWCDVIYRLSQPRIVMHRERLRAQLQSANARNEDAELVQIISKQQALQLAERETKAALNERNFSSFLSLLGRVLHN